MLEKAPDNGKSKGNRQFFSEKTFKKSLTLGFCFDILHKLACERLRERAKRTLKTIQREKRAKKEEDSEDSKEFSIERC